MYVKTIAHKDDEHVKVTDEKLSQPSPNIELESESFFGEEKASTEMMNGERMDDTIRGSEGDGGDMNEEKSEAGVAMHPKEQVKVPTEAPSTGTVDVNDNTEGADETNDDPLDIADLADMLPTLFGSSKFVSTPLPANLTTPSVDEGDPTAVEPASSQDHDEAENASDKNMIEEGTESVIGPGYGEVTLTDSKAQADGDDQVSVVSTGSKKKRGIASFMVRSRKASSSGRSIASSSKSKKPGPGLPRVVTASTRNRKSAPSPASRSIASSSSQRSKSLKLLGIRGLKRQASTRGGEQSTGTANTTSKKRSFASSIKLLGLRKKKSTKSLGTDSNATRKQSTKSQETKKTEVAAADKTSDEDETVGLYSTTTPPTTEEPILITLQHFYDMTLGCLLDDACAALDIACTNLDGENTAKDSSSSQTVGQDKSSETIEVTDATGIQEKGQTQQDSRQDDHAEQITKSTKNDEQRDEDEHETYQLVKTSQDGQHDPTKKDIETESTQPTKDEDITRRIYSQTMSFVEQEVLKMI